eukprot:31223-Ditylum_brightwellii.AAC.1
MATRSHNKDKQRLSKRSPLKTTTSTLGQQNRQQTRISPRNFASTTSRRRTIMATALPNLSTNL